MIKVYPFASGSEYIANRVVSASHAISSSLIPYVISASVAAHVINPRSGSRGMPDICYLTFAQYQLLASGSGSLREDCSTLPERT